MTSTMSTSSPPASRAAEPAHPLSSLTAEDLDLITELVLQSGSLKGLAKTYGVSYPTIRSRLDRVIERLRGVGARRQPPPPPPPRAHTGGPGGPGGGGAPARRRPPP
ncbi:MAG: DUF2089 family protein, partial [Planctomycetota bacterium]